ncbi:O-methyltransferase [Nesterenkonia populi]|uniref:O-methyltransferase n=1 Tax=Nesterenkonia populi TaxID=1591087 RepID=UPI0011BF0D75|nr:methyltransferase domain-containing protein [Nesterenkonia populi]
MTAGSPSSKHTSWAYAEEHAEEPAAAAQARLLAAELGVEPVTPGTAAALTVLAAAGRARTLVDVGSGVGLAAHALLRGAEASGAGSSAVLTGIEPDPECLTAARTLCAQAAPRQARTRFIPGRAEDVLPRLASASYDVVHFHAPAETLGLCLDEAVRMLRAGGMLLISDALDADRTPKPAVRADRTQQMRAAERRIQEDERLLSALIPTGTGLLAAVRAG